ncbi:tRNA pseudouridine(38-40) synthase TruA [Olsenella sp. DNF00959]|uniref:tRNA pseudouridine(38-40) synthase TruA n=1 Tax=Olsenella sp. DNF00959 TaxID=1476999 RepID=UPI0007821A0F|nr:tRNA pseudouridine(38-40) synthase TruA [Olsenella sp. DNF00959]KXB61807.1 tRNA pseudouridine synthase A [Olsenella sp. DNF00959]
MQADQTTSAGDGVMRASAGTLVLRLGYRGAGFAGFAEQPGQRTVAGELRRALQTVLRRPVELECAGRTDAGVSALAQFLSLPLEPGEELLEGRRLHASLVALTPDDISIAGIYRAEAGFSARFDARGRSYRYRICPGPARPVLAWDHSWWLRGVPALDVAAMNEAASALLGEHDFKSFCKAASAQLLEADGRSTCRRLTRVEAGEVVEAGERLVVVDVEGNAFLHNMVRIMVGSLVEVGRGHRDPSWLSRALEARQRSAAGPTAPAQGLCLKAVRYDEGVLVLWE